jgi:hypothetical protein
MIDFDFPKLIIETETSHGFFKTACRPVNIAPVVTPRTIGEPSGWMVDATSKAFPCISMIHNSSIRRLRTAASLSMSNGFANYLISNLPFTSGFKMTSWPS